jgi:serine/threonine-protein kinase
LSEPFEALILACLAKDPTDRPTAAGLQERLLRASALASGAVTPAPTVRETTRNLAQAAREAGTAGATGATRGLGHVVRGLRGRAGPTQASERTPVLPTQAFHRTFRRGRNQQRTALAAGAVALLLLAFVVVVGAPALLGSGAEEEAEPALEEPPAVVAATPAETTTAPVVSGPAPPPSRAEDVVFDMYVQASYQDPNRVWPYLSQRLQDEVGSPEQWAQRERLSTLWNVYFVQMPSAQLSGNDAARVRFQVREIRTGGPELIAGTWELVNEGGEWKLDRLVKENA